MEAVMREKGIAHATVKPNQPEGGKEGVRLATMHRVKGLDFDAVIVAGLSADQSPAFPQGDLDSVALRTYEAQERSLLYVALTRAKRAAVLCYHGEPSGIVKGIEQ
jgi:superfamily I DNA/RNA helicase